MYVPPQYNYFIVIITAITFKCFSFDKINLRAFKGIDIKTVSHKGKEMVVWQLNK